MSSCSGIADSRFVTLHNGAKMPIIGYGTWQAQPGELEAALNAALRVGYRHIDTAAAYENEHVIGDVLQDDWIAPGRLKREDLFLVTKLPPSGMRAGSVETFLQRSLHKLRTSYVDLYLVHMPFGFEDNGEDIFPRNEDGSIKIDMTTDLLAVWKAMEEQVDAGRTRAIGVSNFNHQQIQRILDHCRIKPANLQVELHVYMQQRPLVEFCAHRRIAVTAFSSLGSRGTKEFLEALGDQTTKLPDLLSDPKVLEVAAKYGRSPGQILLKHIMQRGIVVIPKSISPQWIEENLRLFDFQFSNEDMAKLNALDKGPSGRIFDFKFLNCGNHPEYPFEKE